MMSVLAPLLFVSAFTLAAGTIALMVREYGDKARAALRLEHVPAATIARQMPTDYVRVQRSRGWNHSASAPQPVRLAA